MKNIDIAKLFLISRLYRLSNSSSMILWYISGTASGATINELTVFADSEASLGQIPRTSIYYVCNKLEKDGWLIKTTTASEEGGRPCNLYSMSHRARFFLDLNK